MGTMTKILAFCTGCKGLVASHVCDTPRDEAATLEAAWGWHQRGDLVLRATIPEGLPNPFPRCGCDRAHVLRPQGVEWICAETRRPADDRVLLLCSADGVEPGWYEEGEGAFLDMAGDPVAALWWADLPAPPYC